MTRKKMIEEIKKCKNPKEAYYEAVLAEDLDYIKFLADEGNAISKDDGLDFSLESAEWIEHVDKDDKTNPMALAIRQNDFETVDYFMEKHFGNRTPKAKNDSPIIQAWLSDELTMVDFLLTYYYSKEDYISKLLNKKIDSQSPWDAFNEAVRLNDMSLLRYLVEEKKTSLKDCFSNIAGDGVMIHSAIFNRNLEMVKYLVEECKCNPYNYVPKYGTTVRYALEEKQSDILNYLITNCATQLGDSVYDVVLFYIEKKEYEQAYEIIEKSKIDVSALFCHLSYDGQESVFTFLKDLYDKYDIDLSYVNEYGENALGRALYFKLFCDNKKEHEKVFSYLKELYSKRGIIISYEEQGLGYNALTRALDSSVCDGGFSDFDMDLIKYLVEECGFDVNKPDKRDRYPLLTTLDGWKSGREQFAIGKYLIEHGADINVVEYNGQNVLHIIAANKRYGNEEFSWFLDKGVDYLSFDNNGESPLHKAAKARKTAIVKKLVEECGMDPNYHKDGEDYPIHVAAYENRLGMVKWFIKKGSDINSKGRHGITPLFAAVDGFCSSQYSNDGSKLTLVRWLVDNGANLLCLDEDKWTVLHYAAAKGNMIVIKFFVEECHMNPALDCGAGTPAKIAKDFPWFGVNSSAVVRYLHKKEKEYNKGEK